MKNLKIFFLIIFSILTTTIFAQSNIELSALEKTSESLAQSQLEAYNKRDIEGFLINYSESVKVYNFPNELLYEGLTTMRQQYASMFERLPDLHCQLLNRMVNGNTVIDHESVIFNKNNPPMKVFAIYKIENNKIQEVYFVR
jgi:hypothetical protein